MQGDLGTSYRTRHPVAVGPRRLLSRHAGTGALRHRHRADPGRAAGVQLDADVAGGRCAADHPLHRRVRADVPPRHPRPDRVLREARLGARQRPDRRAQSTDRTHRAADRGRAAARPLRRGRRRPASPDPARARHRDRPRRRDRAGTALQPAQRHRQRLRPNRTGQGPFRGPDPGRPRAAQLGRRRTVDDRSAGRADVLRRAGRRAGIRLARHRPVHRAEHPGRGLPGHRRRHPDAGRALRRHQHGRGSAAGHRRSPHQRLQEVRCHNSHSSWATRCSSSSTSNRAAPCLPRRSASRTCPVTPTGSSRAERLVAAARAANVPVVFFQEVHRPSGVDFGRELDGTEGMHCVEGSRAPNWNPRFGPISVAPPRVPHRQAPLLRFHRNRIRHRAARAEGVDADPHRRPHRRVRALHVRRRAPARLPRAGGRPTASAARRSTGTTPRSTRWSTCRPGPSAPPTKSSPPSTRSKPNHDPVLEGAAR